MSDFKDVNPGISATTSEGKAARKPSKLKQFLKEAVEQTLQQSAAASAVSANGVSKHDAGSASASMAVDSGPSVVASAPAAAPVADSGEPKRKRQRTRWAPEEASPSLALASAPASASDGTTASSSDGVAALSSDGAAQPAQSTALVSLVKRRRWGSETEKAPDSPTHDGLAGETMPTTVMPPDPAAIFAAQQHEVLLLRTQVETLSRVQMQIHNGNLEAYYEGRPRSPSPEPVYDGNGRRINSRATRLTMKLNKERTELLQRMMRLSANNPLLGGGVAPVAPALPTKWEEKVWIPVDEHPDYNFKGVIIGPRGMNQKKLEKDTGCRISVRGVGARKRTLHSGPMPGDDEPLHVFIQADSKEKLEQGLAAVKKLMIPVDAAEKARQMKEVAIINGTWRPQRYVCKDCGEDHLFFNCPYRTSSWKSAGVKCELCGDANHLAVDCPNKESVQRVSGEEFQAEYENFAAELLGEASAAVSASLAYRAGIKTLAAPVPGSGSAGETAASAFAPATASSSAAPSSSHSTVIPLSAIPPMPLPLSIRPPAPTPITEPGALPMLAPRISLAAGGAMPLQMAVNPQSTICLNMNPLNTLNTMPMMGMQTMQMNTMQLPMMGAAMAPYGYGFAQQQQQQQQLFFAQQQALMQQQQQQQQAFLAQQQALMQAHAQANGAHPF